MLRLVDEAFRGRPQQAVPWPAPGAPSESQGAVLTDPYGKQGPGVQLNKPLC